MLGDAGRPGHQVRIPGFAGSSGRFARAPPEVSYIKPGRGGVPWRTWIPYPSKVLSFLGAEVRGLSTDSWGKARGSGAEWPAPPLQRLPAPDVALELRLPPEWEERERGCRCVFIDREDGMGRRSDSSRGPGFSSVVTAAQKAVGARKYVAGLGGVALLPSPSFPRWAGEGQESAGGCSCSLLGRAGLPATACNSSLEPVHARAMGWKLA